MNKIMAVMMRKNYRLATAQKAMTLLYAGFCTDFYARSRHLFDRRLSITNFSVYNALVNHPSLNNEKIGKGTTTNLASRVMAPHDTRDAAIQAVYAAFTFRQFSKAASPMNKIPDGSSGGLGIFGVHQEKLIVLAMEYLYETAVALRSEAVAPLAVSA